MSPLTKMFVVLLVIVSMLNAAAIVVFVNKARPLQPELDAKQSALKTAQDQATANMLARQMSEDQYHTEAELRAKDQSTAAAAVGALQSQLNEANVTIASLKAENTNLQAGVNTANANAQLSSSTANKLQEQVTALRTTNDNLTRQNDEYSRHNAELTSTLETVQARLQDTQEQLAASKDNAQKLSGFLKDKGYEPDQILGQQAAGYSPGGPAINGIVRDKSIINGNTFVTISVGSADGVVKGMKFDVVVGTHYLGTITIDTVDTDDAIGRLDGPQAGKVEKGYEVKTQIRGS